MREFGTDAPWDDGKHYCSDCAEQEVNSPDEICESCGAICPQCGEDKEINTEDIHSLCDYCVNNNIQSTTETNNICTSL